MELNNRITYKKIEKKRIEYRTTNEIISDILKLKERENKILNILIK